MAPKISENINNLTENVRDYVNLRLDLARLTLTEKMAQLISLFLISVIFFIMGMFLLLFLSMAFVFWFGNDVGPAWLGALIVVAFYVVLGLFVYMRRYQLFLNPLVSKLTKILMEDHHEDE